MRTLLIHDGAEPPTELREIVRAGSTEVEETVRAAAHGDADRIVIVQGHDVTIDDRRLRWPDDRDEIRMLFDTGG